VLADIGSHAADIDEAILGCVLPAGLKQPRPARRCWARASPAVPATTVNKMCGSA
jgi:acetyl-CoA C-acetyltransferase